MTPDQLKILNDTIGVAIQTHVNGKIDALRQSTTDFHLKFKEHVARVEPVIKKYEEEKVFNDEVNLIGKRTIFYAKVVAAVGVIVIAVREALTFKV